MKRETVVAAYIVKKGKVLLIDHKKLGKWLPVGGHIGDNEAPDDAVKREVREEVGLEINFAQYPPAREGNQREYALPFYTNVHQICKGHEHYCLFYLCTPKRGKIKINTRELNGYNWFGKTDLNHFWVPESVKLTGIEAINLANNT